MAQEKQPSQSTTHPVSPQGAAEVTNRSKRHSRLPSWLHADFNAPDLTVYFRCWVAAWVASLLMFIGPTLRVIGTETFFACIVLFILPPAGILFIFILGGLTLCLGMCLAWAWGVIAMKAALAARPVSETQAQFEALQQQAYLQANSSGQSVASETQVLIDNGFMLDARVTAVWFALMCLFIYFLARMRANNPKTTLLQIIATIIADLFLTIGPSLPSFSGTLPVTLVKPGAIGVGLGFVANILFFPQSTSHTVLAAMERLLELANHPLEFTAQSLEADDGDRQLDLRELQGLKAKTIATYEGMETATRFLPLDFSIGRWNADDIESLKEPVRRTIISSLSLLEVHIARLARQKRLEEFPLASNDESVSDRDAKKKPTGGASHQQFMQNAYLVRVLQHLENEALHRDCQAALRRSTAEILPACLESVTIVEDCIHASNSSKWNIFQPSKEKFTELLRRSKSALETLKLARDDFPVKTTEHLSDAYADFLDDIAKSRDMENLSILRLKGVMMCMVFEEQVLSVSDALQKLLYRVIQLCEGRERNKIWFPSGIRTFGAWALKKRVRAPIVGPSPDVDPDTVEEASQEAQRRLQISQGLGGRRRGIVGRLIIGSYGWFASAEGLFALRMVVVTIALAIPAVIPSSAGFYYREKGIWGLIMGQSTLLVYMADFTYSLISRAVGTVVGGVAGLVVWYIGSGDGPGNPYGLGAAMAVAVAILMWARLFLNSALLQATIFSAATCLLVVGYSYDDTHNAHYGNPGVGYNVFWRRLVLVLVGFAAAVVVQVFPRPPSAFRHTCKTLSNTLRALSDHYALLLSCWGQSNIRVGVVAERITIDVADTLTALKGSIALLRLEFSSCPFDSHSLGRVESLCQEMNQALGQLLNLSVSLPMGLQERLARQTGLLNQRGIGDIMAVLSVMEQSLRTGNALPEVLPTPLLKRCYEYWTSSEMETVLSRDLIRDENYRKFFVAVSSYLKFLSAVDDLVLVVKGALGESHIIGKELLEVV